MTEPTDDNLTGVESYDHSSVASLSEYHDVRKALDAFVKATREQELGVGQAEFLKMAEQMAASLAYSDSSGHPRNDCADMDEGAWPYKADIKDGWLTGTYRCARCGEEWTVGYDVNVVDFL